MGLPSYDNGALRERRTWCTLGRSLARSLYLAPLCFPMPRLDGRAYETTPASTENTHIYFFVPNQRPLAPPVRMAMAEATGVVASSVPIKASPLGILCTSIQTMGA